MRVGPKVLAFNWLPDGLAFRYAQRRRRATLGGARHTDQIAQVVPLLRRGRGVILHEIDSALVPEWVGCVASCMQLERRKRVAVRRLARWLSAAGCTEHAARPAASLIHRSWPQPFLCLTLRKP